MIVNFLVAKEVKKNTSEINVRNMFYLIQYVSLIAPTTAVVAVLLVLVQLLSRVCNPMDCGPPGSPVLQYILDFAQILIH